MEEVIDVRLRWNQRNPPPFMVQDYVREVDRYLNAQWFLAVVAGPDGEVDFRDEHGRRKRNC